MYKTILLGGSLLISFLTVNLGHQLKALNWLVHWPQIMMVASGSMAPTINFGSALVVMPESEYRIGDVVTYRSSQVANSSITHRITEIHQQPKRLSYQLKGDNNNSPDQLLVTTDQIVGKVIWQIPYLGYIGMWLQTPLGVVLLIVVPSTIILYEEVKELIAALKASRRRVKVSAT